MTKEEKALQEKVDLLIRKHRLLKEQLGRVIIGQEGVLDLLVTAVLADGHVLLEGLPGLGKTLMVKTLAQALSLGFNRIQFTPDLMPADITGTTIITGNHSGERSFTFEPGPLFTNLLLADEINRASPKTQSALLQAMQEKEVSIFGRHYPLEDPFLVFATQNPIELAGTYPLPEAQLDRFMFKVVVPSPAEDDLIAIARETTGVEMPSADPVLDKEEILSLRRLIREVPVAEPVMKGISRSILALAPGSDGKTRRHILYGISPRGFQALLLAAKVHACLDGRYHVSIEAVRPFWLPALRHRLMLDVSAGMEGITSDDILREVGSRLEVA